MKDFVVWNAASPLRDGDDAVEIWLRSVYQQYSTPLYRYALALTCSVEDAQDAVQEVFTRISRKQKHFTEVKNVNAYLFRATRNAAYSILRGRKRCASLHETICADLLAVCSPKTKPTSATIMCIREAFTELRIEQREVIILKILNQMTFKEIAETTRASINTVAGRYRYGIERLRKSLIQEVEDI